MNTAKTSKVVRQSGLRDRAEVAAGLSRRVEGRPSDNAEQLVQELQVHEIELEMQADELRRAHEEIEASRDRYRDLFDFAPVGYVTLDAGGSVIEANVAAELLLGVDRDRLFGRP